MKQRGPNAVPMKEGQKERIQCEEPQAIDAPKLPQNQEYLSVRDVAKRLGVSTRSVYDYIASGTLKGERIGQSIVVHRDDLQAYRHSPAGRPRRHPPIWRMADAANRQHLLSISVRLLPGQGDFFIQTLAEMRQEQKHLIPGTVERFISRHRDEPEAVRIVLVWRQRLMPPEEERQKALAALREEFADILDWDHASSLEGPVLLAT